MHRYALVIGLAVCGCGDDGSSESSSGEGSSSSSSTSTSTTDASSSSTTDPSTSSSSTSGASTGAATTGDGTTGGVNDTTIVFLNFDGGQFTMGQDDPPNDVAGIPLGTVQPYQGDRADVLARVRAYYDAFDIRIVDQRPPSGDYDMVVIGVSDMVPGGADGLAPLDCGNSTSNQVAATYTNNNPGPQRVSAVTASGIGILLGLEHHMDSGDLMAFDPGTTAEFTDVCIAFENPPGCPRQSDACDAGEQNSVQELLAILGPAQ